MLIAWLQRGTAWHIPLISSEVASPGTLLSSLLSPHFPSCGGAVCLSDSYLPPDLTHTLKLPYKRLNFSRKKGSGRGFWILMGLGADMGGYWVAAFVFHICDDLKQTLWLFTTDITTEDGRPSIDCGARFSMAPHSTVRKHFQVLKIHHCCK